MLILRNIIITLLLLTLAAIAVVGIMVEAPPVFNWTPDRINDIGRSVVHILRPGLLLFIIWVVVFLATMLVFFMTIARPRRRMKIEVQMGGGRVVIMDAAIKRYVRNALSELNEVTVKKIDLREQRGQVTTDIYADVRTRENLPTLERRIISRVRTALAEDLGITNLGDVHVYIKNFEVTGRSIKPAPEPAEQPDVAPVPAAYAATGAGAVGAASGANVPSVEPVIGGEKVSDAETLPEDAPLTFASGESAAFPSATAAEQAPTLTPVTETDEVILAEKALPAQKDNLAENSLADGSLADHEELDEPLPWDLVRPDQPGSESDEDKNSGGLRSS